MKIASFHIFETQGCVTIENGNIKTEVRLTFENNGEGLSYADRMELIFKAANITDNSTPVTESKAA